MANDGSTISITCGKLHDAQWSHGLSIFENFNLSITKLQKVKHFLQVKWHD
jgi:hypothetical protein